MGQINITQFLAYFNTWYPIIIPSVVLSLALAALLIDRVRTWCLSYVDDAENGPYALFIWPFLLRLAGKPSAGEEHPNAPRVPEGFTHVREYCGNYFYQVGGFWKYVYTRDHDIALRMDEYIRTNRSYIIRHGLGGSDNVVRSELSRGSVGHISYTDSDDAFTPRHIRLPSDGDYAGILALYLMGMIAVLIAYKYVPVVTVACGIGYGMLYLARGVVRLTKKLKAHITDPNAHKQEAVEEA